MSELLPAPDGSRPGHVFRIYLAGESPNSTRALANLYAICRKYYPDSHRIDIIDVLKEAQSALAHAIFVTPTVVRLSPVPEVHIIGNLTDEAEVLHALGLPQAAVPT
jgi:circadian clock protein KaiB